MKSAGMAAAMATPKPKPRAIPIRAPYRVTTAASQRIMRRAWRRVMPTARSRPISRVRSNTDSVRVLTMPTRAMSRENPRNTFTSTSRVLRLDSAEAWNSERSSRLAWG